MCTVSMVPVKAGYVFTFNRDEQPLRQTPHYKVHEDLGYKNIYFAMDSKAGGTWFGADNRGNIAMLFNGAFDKHQKQETYTKSRGIILLELLRSPAMFEDFQHKSLYHTEPFSVILLEDKKLYRLSWDGITKHIQLLDSNTPHIFSSATLYENEIQQQRKTWLDNFLNKQLQVTDETVYHFHASHNITDRENGLCIAREGSCSTLSISQAIWQEDHIRIRHKDLVTGQLYQQDILLQ